MSLSKCPIIILLIILAIPVPASAYAETFRFQYAAGEKHRILTTVSEDVLINGRLNNHSEIINRITEEVTDITESGAQIYGTFMTSEEATQPKAAGETKNFSWGTEYESSFHRDHIGQYTVDDSYFMPTVRNIPVFPEEDVTPGSRWYADGYEVHDMRRDFAMAKPLKVPFTATYTYQGTEEAEDRTLHVITAEYTLYTEYPVPRGADGSYPVTVMGFSSRTIYFDNDIGKVITWKEKFRIVLETKRGDHIEYRGESQTEVDKSSLPDRSAMIAALQEQIESLGIENTGVTISIENIQFLPDSAWLAPEEKEKLTAIAQMLAPFTQNDLLITGHTARVGSEDSCQTLSLQRAHAVADYLKTIGVKDEYHIFTQGMGSRIPIADNSTEAGRERNRRVEITIIE